MTLDSNIIIALLDKEDSVVAEVSRFQEMGFTFFLPTVTESEVLSFQKWTDSERRIVEKFLEENFTSVSFDRTLARIVARMRRETNQNSRCDYRRNRSFDTNTPCYSKPQGFQKHIRTSSTHDVAHHP